MLLFLLACRGQPANDPTETAVADDSGGAVDEGPFLSHGSVPRVGQIALDCPKAERYAPGPWGTLEVEGHSFTVPYEPTSGATCAQTYDPCVAGGPVAYEPETVVIDPDGPIWDGFVFGDNAFELWVNGTFVCTDPILFVPFDAHAVRFQANPPLTIALKLGDWEEVNGVGVEYDTKTGDGGAIARFTSTDGDEVITGTDWRCFSVYAAPMDDPKCLVGHDSSACSTKPSCPADSSYGDCYAASWETPDDWMSPQFDDSAWPHAVAYDASDVTNDPAYTYDTKRFGGASFVWSSNLVVDDTLLCRN